MPRLKDRELAEIFNVTLANALDTTFEHVDGRDDTFVITGDIKAMWIRDSTFQVRPYARYFLRKNVRTSLSDAICGLVRRQSRSVLLDQYANAFNFDGKGPGGPHQGDRRRPKMTKHLYEGKYELDSLVSSASSALRARHSRVPPRERGLFARPSMRAAPLGTPHKFCIAAAVPLKSTLIKIENIEIK